MTNPYPGGQSPYPSGGQNPRSSPGGHPQQHPGQPAGPYPNGPGQAYPQSGPQQAYPQSGQQQAYPQYPQSGPQQAQPHSGPQQAYPQYPQSGPQQAYPAGGAQQGYPQGGAAAGFGQPYPQAGQPSPYGQPHPQTGYPAYPGANDLVSRPASVNRAFLFLLIACGLDFVGLVIGAFVGPAAGHNASSSSSTAIFGASILLGLIVIVIKDGLWALLIFLMRAGQNWARITMTVIGCPVGVIILIASVGDVIGGIAVLAMRSGAGAVMLLAGLLLLGGVGMMIAGFVGMFRASANRYFSHAPA